MLALKCIDQGPCPYHSGPRFLAPEGAFVMEDLLDALDLEKQQIQKRRGRRRRRCRPFGVTFVRVLCIGPFRWGTDIPRTREHVGKTVAEHVREARFRKVEGARQTYPIHPNPSQWITFDYL